MAVFKLQITINFHTFVNIFRKSRKRSLEIEINILHNNVNSFVKFETETIKADKTNMNIVYIQHELTYYP